MHGFVTNLCNYKYMFRSSEKAERVLEVVEVLEATLIAGAADYTETCNLIFKYKDTTNS